jgi:hypothetical protein
MHPARESNHWHADFVWHLGTDSRRDDGRSCHAFSLKEEKEMTPAEQITHLKAQLSERDEAIRELNERASSHLRSSQDTIQALKLELDKANAKLRERQRVLVEKVFLDLPPYEESLYTISQDLVDQLKGYIQPAKLNE